MGAGAGAGILVNTHAEVFRPLTSRSHNNDFTQFHPSSIATPLETPIVESLLDSLLREPHHRERKIILSCLYRGTKLDHVFPPAEQTPNLLSEHMIYRRKSLLENGIQHTCYVLWTDRWLDSKYRPLVDITCGHGSALLLLLFVIYGRRSSFRNIFSRVYSSNFRNSNLYERVNIVRIGTSLASCCAWIQEYELKAVMALNAQQVVITTAKNQLSVICNFYGAQNTGNTL